MSWKLRCPFCQIEYKIEPEHQGTVCKCAKCGKEFTIPDDIQAWLADMPEPPGRRADQRQEAPADRQAGSAESRRTAPRRRRKRCPECLQDVPGGAEFCPHCGYNLRAGYRSGSGGKPFFCHLLNILGIFATFGGGLGLVGFGIFSAAAYLNPADAGKYFDGRGATDSPIIAFAIFFGGLMLFGLSSLIHRASRRW